MQLLDVLLLFRERTLLLLERVKLNTYPADSREQNHNVVGAPAHFP